MSKVNDETPSIRTASEVNQKNKDYWQPSWGPQPESDDQQRNPTGVARDIEYKGLSADSSPTGLGEAGEHEGMAQDEAKQQPTASTPAQRKLATKQFNMRAKQANKEGHGGHKPMQDGEQTKLTPSQMGTLKVSGQRVAKSTAISRKVEAASKNPISSKMRVG